MNFNIAYFFLAILIANALETSAQSQSVQCGDSEYECLADAEMIRTLNLPENRSGFVDVAVGVLCEDEQLQAIGKQKFESSLSAVNLKVQQNVRTVLSNAPFASVTKILSLLDRKTKIAREREIVGIALGLKTVFSKYPRTKAEFCFSMKPEETPAVDKPGPELPAVE